MNLMSRHPAAFLGILAGLAMATGCASPERDYAMGLSGGENRRPYTPNFYDSYNSSVQYYQNTRTAMVEGNSSLTANTYMLTHEQRNAIEQVRQHREIQQQLNW